MTTTSAITLTTFEAAGFKLRTFMKDGKLWLIGTDILAGLTLAHRANAYSRLADDEKCYVRRTDLGLPPGKPMIAVSESGFYKLVLRSDKEEAAPYQEWVTREVLPAIRRTGGYRLAGVEPEAVEEGVTAEMPDVGGFTAVIRAEMTSGSRTRQFDALRLPPLAKLGNRPLTVPLKPTFSPDTLGRMAPEMSRSVAVTAAFAVPVQVVDLPFLASEINSAHRQITVHARGMLLEAKRAGDALLAAKAKVKHGEFEGWVRAQTRCSIQTARRYMQVAKLARSKTLNLESFEGGMVAFLEAHAKPRIPPSSPTPAFTEQDAERVLNIAARAERGEGAERAVAAEMLVKVAASHGTTPEPMLALSKSMCPDIDTGTDQNENEPTQANGDREEVKCPLAAHRRREDLILKLMDHDENERLEMLADALIRIEELEERFG